MSGKECFITSVIIGLPTKKSAFQFTLHNYERRSKKNQFTLHNYGKVMTQKMSALVP